MLKNSSKNGFTLIELIIVVSIIGLLSVIGISSFTSIQQDARNAKRKGDLKEMQKAIEAFKSRNGRYPSTCSSNAVSCAFASSSWRGTCSLFGSHGDTGATGYIPGLAPEFIPILPHDPREDYTNSARSPYCGTAGTNCYLYRSTGTDYKLLAHCTPEGDLSREDAFYDPGRDAGGIMWAWQVSSSSVSRAW